MQQPYEKTIGNVRKNTVRIEDFHILFIITTSGGSCLIRCDKTPENLEIINKETFTKSIVSITGPKYFEIRGGINLPMHLTMKIQIIGEHSSDYSYFEARDKKFLNSEIDWKTHEDSKTQEYWEFIKDSP